LSTAAIDRLRGLARRGVTLERAAAELGRTTADLAELIEGKAKVRSAWDRGRLLHQVARLAEIPASVEEAASDLGMGADELAAMIAPGGDPEIREIWTSRQIKHRRSAMAALRRSARRGSVSASRELLGRLAELPSGAAEVNWQSIPWQTFLAELSPVSKQSLYAWARDHGMPRNADGSMHLRAWIAWYGDYREARGVEKGGGSTAESEYERERVRKLKLANDLHEGLLVEREQVIRGLVARAYAYAGIADRAATWAQVCQGKPAGAMREYLEGELRNHLRSVAVDPPRLKLSGEQERTLRRLLASVAGVSTVGDTDEDEEGAA
jgi:hypothetical protein